MYLAHICSTCSIKTPYVKEHMIQQHGSNYYKCALCFSQEWIPMEKKIFLKASMLRKHATLTHQLVSSMRVSVKGIFSSSPFDSCFRDLKI